MEYIGYVASLIVLISLLMSSVRKLRWINLIGSITFTFYGFMIDSLPVAILNIGTSIINIYYLYNMYLAKDYFTVLPITGKTRYFDYFLEYYKNDIKKYLPTETLRLDEAEFSFYILRNIVPAGVFVCSKHDQSTLKIDLDYVVPNYRDFKIGRYIFTKQKALFVERGYTKLITVPKSAKHCKYLEKMGFALQAEVSNSKQVHYQIDISK